MGMTRATFLIAGALVVSLVVAAAGIGAYIAVRHSAPPPDATVADGELAAGTAAALHGIDARVVAGEPRSGNGMAVESTEQILDPASATADADPPAVETSRAQREPATAAGPPAPAPAPAPRRPAARPADRAAPRREPPRPEPEVAERAASSSAGSDPSRPAPTVAERAAPRPAPGVARPAPEPPSPEAVTRQQEGRASRDLPQVDGWRPAPASSTADPDTPARGEDAVRNRPPLASANLDLPLPDAGADAPPPATEQLLIPADSVIGLQIDTFVTTDRAEVEDDVQARVTRDVKVSRRVVIPAGSVVNGSVVMVERGGKLQGASRLGVRFHTVVLGDGVEVPIVTETVYREGRSRGRDNAARIGGGAVAGAILGAIFGGGRGAAIGSAAGAAGGTAAAAAGDAEPATLPAGTTLTVRLSRPGSVTVER